MAGANTKIAASDYNQTQSIIASVLGPGLGNVGYNQSISSSQVSANQQITAAQWNNLKADIVRARSFQVGTDQSSTLTTASNTIEIKDSDRAAYLSAAQSALANRTPGASNQFSLANLVPPVQETIPWNGTIQHTVTVNFGSDAAARAFFNSGGEIQISATIVGPFSSASTQKDLTWQTMFTAMGIIKLGATSVTYTGTGGSGTATAANYGFYNSSGNPGLPTSLGGTGSLIFTQFAPIGNVYYPNEYLIYAAYNGAGTLYVNPQFNDASTGTIDENVDGTTTSIVQAYYPTGSFISLPLPSASSTTFTGGASIINNPSPTITLSPASLGAATENVSYSQTITATGGTAPYSYRISFGNLPTGLSLNSSTGAITGTPSSPGTFSFTVVAFDSKNFSSSGTNYSIDVTPATGTAPTITLAPTNGSTLTPAYINQYYSYGLAAIGGTAPYTYAIIGGVLPPGVGLNNTNGLISGTPVKGGSYSITVIAYDFNSYTSSAYTYSLTVVETVTVSPYGPFYLTYNVAYNGQFNATGGTAPYTFTVSSGSFPPGLTLSTSGAVSGTPNSIGSYTFTVTATDSVGITGSDTVTATVENIIVGPSGPFTLQLNQAYNGQFSASGGTAPYSFSIGGGSLPTGLTLSSSGAVTGTPTVTGTYSFSVNAVDTHGVAGFLTTSATIN